MRKSTLLKMAMTLTAMFFISGVFAQIDITVKTSTGALYNIPVCKEGNLVNIIKYLQSSGITIFSASEKSAEYIYDADFAVPAAVVMGSEEDGVSDSILKISDKIVKLPMAGQTASLNVSVAAGAILYEAVRQRMLQDLF